MGSRSRFDPANLDAAEKGRQALELRRDGKTWDAIAEELGYSDRSGAYIAAKRLLDRTEFESVEEYRAIEADRLDEAHRIQAEALVQLANSRALDAIPPAVNALVKISDRRSKLLGLDAPTRVDVAHSGEDFAATAARLMKEIGLAVPSEFQTPDAVEEQGGEQDGGDPWVR
ncbi:hypothetical protein MYP14_06125 [Rhodococcus pyridinivorans]|uniref:hypothetical protein n=1 Tax=Rhodococcus pyridinivorans TaxID=103816 RepID=UPI001FFF7FB2|nr:hypothetical protein [Rhodococcus pyridinivorans]UPK64926.1 hypothetical protein MYP14_06125 [Rhodococcus pyridinivorans]